jgi:glycosyltransferase involved in cell wall biosynthesis
MQAADVLCLPSQNEGLPNVILEAFACDLPVAATRVGGVPELVTADFLGRLVAPNDPLAMAEALGRLIKADRTPGAVAQHAQKFSWPAAACAYREALRSLVGEGGA